MPINNTNQPPIVLLIFANDREVPERYLRNLADEAKAIKAALKNAEKKGLCQVEELPNVTIKDIYDFFQDDRYSNRIAIFHYGGHANSYELLLEAANRTNIPAFAAGLIPFLARQKGLELIFLNGCNTQLQATQLIEEGISAVIGTAKAVKDKIAFNLADRFYKGLGEGHSISNAWEAAKDEFNTGVSGSGKSRDIFLRQHIKDDNTPLWKLNIRPGAETIENWSLPIAANNPLFGLPKLKGYNLPEEPYRFLGRYKQEDAPIFFGRGKKIRTLYFRVTDGFSAPVILLAGQSGVGKSSLLEAGLLPRIKENYQVQYLRRTPMLDLVSALKQVLLPTVNPTEKTVEPSPVDELLKNGLAAWKKIEQDNGQPLIIILDQAEGVFTRVSKTQPQELSHFLAILQTIFNTPQNSPQGKLIFSYRKEFHTDFEAEFKQKTIPQEAIFLAPLNKEEIIEVVEGLMTTESLRRKYALTIAPGLSNLIAEELITDKESPIAPVLQIILTKLWQQQEPLDQRKFTITNYQKLKEAGILLKDFYQQQMEKIQAWDQQHGKDTVQSGLALDILAFHTTQWQVAESRTLEKLRTAYEHRQDVLEDLLHQFDATYLLAWLSKDKTALAHDTLAPIVRYNSEISDKPGQKARRILETKMINYQQEEETIIEPEDLALVENGKDGMRVWTLQEQKLIKKSQAYRDRIEEERRAQEAFKKRNRVLVVALLSSLLVGAAFWGRSNYWDLQVKAAVTQALIEEKADPTIAWQTIQEAIVIDPTNAIVLQTRNDIYNKNEFYADSWPLGKTVTDLSPVVNRKIAIAIGKEVKLLNQNGVPIWTKVQDKEVLSVEASVDGSELLIAGKEGIVKVLDTSTGDVINTMRDHKDWIRKAIFLADTQHVLSGDRNGQIVLWDRVTNTILKTYAAHEDEIWDLAYSPTNQQFVSVSWDGTAKLWSLETGFLADLPIVGRGLSAAYSHDGTQIAIGDRNNTIYLFDTSGTLQHKILAHDKRINVLQYAPNSRIILSASDDKTIRLWDTLGNPLKIYKGHQDFVYDLAFTVDGKGFYSCSEDGTVKRWQIESKVMQYFGSHENEVTDLAISEDGALMVSGSGSGQQAVAEQISDIGFDPTTLFDLEPQGQNAYIWHLDTDQAPDTLIGHTGGITAVAISKKANMILTASEDATVRFWDLKGAALSTIIEHQAGVYDVAFSPDGKWFATASYDRIIVLGKTATLLADTLHLRQPSEVEAIAFSPDQAQLLVGLAGTEAVLLNFTGQEIRRFSKNRAGITAVAFSPDGERVLIGDAGNEGVLYSVRGDSLTTFSLEEKTKTGGEGVTAVAFSGDGKLIALAGVGGITKVIKLEHGEVVQILRDLWLESVGSVAFFGDRIFVGNEDGVIRKYNLITR